MESEDWFDRLKEEKEELEKRLWRLEDFIDPAFPEHSEFLLLPEAEQADLKTQFDLMASILIILERRIRREKEKRLRMKSIG